MKMNYVILFIMCLFLIVVVCTFLSIDTQHWSREYVNIKRQSRAPMVDLQYDVVDIFSGGA